MRHKRLLWLDIETTGLDEKNCYVLEVGAAVTNINLEIVDTFHVVLHQSKTRLKGMNSWCKKQHKRSGLIDEVKTSMVSMAEAEQGLIKWMIKNRLISNIVLHGSSIHFDRRFIKLYMPRMEACLSYRMMDVTSFKLLFDNKFGITYEKKMSVHRVLDDIQDSIDELKFYLKYIKPGGTK